MFSIIALRYCTVFALLLNDETVIEVLHCTSTSNLFVRSTD